MEFNQEDNVLEMLHEFLVVESAITVYIC